MKSIFSTNFINLEVTDKITVIALYSAIVLAVLITAFIIIAKFLRPDALKSVVSGAKYLGLGYAIAFGTIMLTLSVSEMAAEEEIFPLIFYPILAILAVAVIAAIGWIMVRLIKPEFSRTYKFIALGAVGAAIIAALVSLGVYYANTADWYEDVSEVGLYIGAVVLIAAIVAAALVFGKKTDEKDNTRALAYAAVCIALSFALSYIRLFRMPQGGSVTAASILPLLIYSYMFGIRRGVAAGFIYGLMQAMQDPWIIHPAQFLLDYPVAYAAVGLAGIFRDVKVFKGNVIVTFVLGAMVAGFGKYISQVMSGIFAFAMYAPDGFSPVTWGFLYNTVVLVDLAIAMVAGTVALCSKSFRRIVLSKSAKSVEKSA